MPDAPTITPAIEKAFLDDDLLRNHLTASFYRILYFYGLARTPTGVVKAENWEIRKLDWFTQSTHNDLRITRILKCLMTLGLKSEAIEFYEALCPLQKSESDCGIEPEVNKFWAEALGE